MTINQHAKHILDNTDMALIVYHEDGSDDLELQLNCNYCDLLGIIAQLVYDVSEENDIPLAEIGEDLNMAVKTVEEARGALDD
jgi:hypothetical protein